MKPYLGPFLVAGTLTLSAPAQAEQLASYFTELGYQDYFNSRGMALTDAAAVLQQDRANFHRFGLRHPGDEPDPYFGNQQTRAAIPELFRAGPNRGYPQNVLSGGWPGHASQWLIQICGGAGYVTHIVVDPADGDGYSDC